MVIKYDQNNIFSKILRGIAKCDKVYEDKFVLAFKDMEPVAPVHILVIPKESFQSLHDFAVGSDNVGHFFKILRDIAEECNLTETGYRVVMNHNMDAGQMVYHFHAHIIGGKKLGGIA